MFQSAMQQHQPAAQNLDASSFLMNFVQNTLINPFKAFSDGNVLSVVIFSMLIGLALVYGGERFSGIRRLSQEFFELVMLLVPCSNINPQHKI